MNKTIHQKLTSKHFYTHATSMELPYADDLFPGLKQEIKILKQAASDLLCPRPEAINRILELSRTM